MLCNALASYQFNQWCIDPFALHCTSYIYNSIIISIHTEVAAFDLSPAVRRPRQRLKNQVNYTRQQTGTLILKTIFWACSIEIEIEQQVLFSERCRLIIYLFSQVQVHHTSSAPSSRFNVAPFINEHAIPVRTDRRVQTEFELFPSKVQKCRELKKKMKKKSSL